MSSYPRISFGIIVLNGSPFTRYCLRSLYTFAHEIIVVEGGHAAARAVTTPDGHSIDATLESLRQFKEDEDPEGKVQIVTRDGFWPKMEGTGDWRTFQSRAYAERATGDYLWQVDIDEFYRPEDMRSILELLRDDPSITAVSFQTRTFWARPCYIADSWALRRGASTYHRLFKWGPGHRYTRHEPPTVHDAHGRDLRTLNWIGGDVLARRGIYMYHYSLLFPWQVEQKTRVYEAEKPEYCAEIVRWAEENYFRIGSPYRVHNLYRHPSWLERFEGAHPPEIVRMMEDVRCGRISADLRRTDDIESLLRTWWYPVGARLLQLAEPWDQALRRTLVDARHLVPFRRSLKRVLARRQ